MTDQEINVAIAEACGWTRYGLTYTDRFQQKEQINEK